MSSNDAIQNEDIDLVATWLDADKVRFAAGIAAGLFAGLVAMAFGGLLAAGDGLEFWFPIKLMGAALIGPSAMELGFNVPSIAAGLALVEVLGAFWGFVYAHFVKTDSLGSLLAMGVVWSLFGWIFHWNLFFHSIKVILYSGVSPGAAFPVFLAYGVSLTSVAFFDRAFRGGGRK